ncbi:hypothetical protein BDY17DRAFT_311407 [Neohortaea acidophila]|uniref:PH domain-containing protein n=1 Tax=Neohortaea acidophila TaxID=245834 RepID=A0A6A6PRB3_9PEZI|nr:uncharacterized protein BDY17DRAFT_311407 [Neohortaea acidophila]KAF2481747.1 hypothetical protein BDY17DRAFT_311407 [Neohortaea acidophila]
MGSVPPLRINKNTTPGSSPVKMLGQATSRPLAEIGSTERRRNSPSYIQATKKMIVTTESSPYTENSSPPSFAKPSPRGFWANRDTKSPSRFDSENSPAADASPVFASPKRRPSVERLMQSSPVRKSHIFALESKDAYDPSTLPKVERPAPRPLSQSVANNTFARFDSQMKENTPLSSPQRFGHRRNQSQTELPVLTPSKSPGIAALSASLEGEQQSPLSPTKSSLARNSKFGGYSQPAVEDDWSDGGRATTPRALNMQRKSVTFHHDPPVVNEYEEQTPEPSLSIASDREGSWESDDLDDRDIHYDRGSSADVEHHREDSFDADLENSDKTPVVLPEDWSRMSPDEARTDLADQKDDVFEDHARSNSNGRVASDGEARPLPPLPAFMQRERSGSDLLASAAERASNAVRGPPSPPKRASCSKDDILQMIAKSSPATQKPSQEDEEGHEALIVTNLDTGEKVQVEVHEAAVEEDSVIADLADFAKAPPRISRESILRSVRNSKYDFEDFDDEDDADESQINLDDADILRPSIAELARMDPDQPIPSRESSREISVSYPLAHGSTTHQPPASDVPIKEEPTEDNDIDMSSIPASIVGGLDRQSSVLHHRAASLSGDEDEADTASRYSSLDPPDAESSMIHTRREIVEHEDGKETLTDAMELLTVKDYSARVQAKQGTRADDFLGLPAYLSMDDFDFGMKDYITPSPPSGTTTSKKAEEQQLFVQTMPQLQPPLEFKTRDAVSTAWSPRAEPEVSPPSTPDAVIKHDDGIVSPLDGLNGFASMHVPRESPVPERVASIKTPGGKLKARPSATPADLAGMAEQRRMVSEEPPVPAVPSVYQTMEDTTIGAEDDASSSVYSNDEVVEALKQPVEQSEKPARRKNRKSGGRMDLSLLDTSTFSLGGGDDGLGLDEDFDRISEAQKVSSAPFPPPAHARFDPQRSMLPQAQSVVSYGTPISPYRPHPYSSAGTDLYTRTQKGYLMRENTKVVIATTRDFSGDSNGTAESGSTIRGSDNAHQPQSPTSETPKASRTAKKDNSSPRKASAEQFLKTEPWNGKVRRKSVRLASAQQAAHLTDVAPPLPGQESALGVVDEDYAAGSSNLEDDVGEGVERGRLFVKVVGVNDLALPLPRNDRVYFQLTLDNGLHCVTTSSLELGTSAPIGQEFELVVLNDLEFQLTLTTKLPPPPPVQTPPSSSGWPTKSPTKQKTSGFARFLSSPKKRAEKERQEREAAEAEERRLQEDFYRKRASVAPTAWDLLRDLVNESDGSFARAYVNLKAHEKQCFGRQLTVDVPCYNEWALEKDVQVVNSVRNKRGTLSGPVRLPPYVIGQLRLQLLYVPKPKGATDDDMPKSMSAAVREMKKAGESSEVVHEGHLSQQGGDCTHWRRRFFRLQGSKLTAYHEHTQQKRAVINLTRASRLVDGKRMLTADPSPAKAGKGRRKSAFAEEDEAYQYVEEGFRMRFANGETIDFYAESREKKDEWMLMLSKVIGKPDGGARPSTWTDLVLVRERATGGARSESAVDSSSPVKEAAAPEVKDFAASRPPTAQKQPSAIPTSSRSVPTSPTKGPPLRSAPMPPAAAAPATRPRTPPMSARKGHRSRDAVKSMIF